MSKANVYSVVELPAKTDETNSRFAVYSAERGEVLPGSHPDRAAAEAERDRVVKAHEEMDARTEELRKESHIHA